MADQDTGVNVYAGTPHPSENEKLDLNLIDDTLEENKADYMVLLDSDKCADESDQTIIEDASNKPTENGEKSPPEIAGNRETYLDPAPSPTKDKDEETDDYMDMEGDSADSKTVSAKLLYTLLLRWSSIIEN